jgi:hypothetical protein
VADSGVHSVVVSFIKVFYDEAISGKVGTQVSENLFTQVDTERVFDALRVEIVTKGKTHFSFSGKIYGPVPKFDEIIPLEDFERSINESKLAENFDFNASVRLSVTYPISEFSEFLEEAEDEGFENPNLFTWIEYCIDDANEVLGEDRRSAQDLKPLLTIRGI